MSNTNDYLHALQHAAFLNSLAVTSLVNLGDSDDCVTVLNGALSVMEQVSGCAFLETTGANLPRVWQSFDLPAMKYDDHFYICRQALMFSVADKTSINDVEVSFYSAIVLWNTALRYHWQGLKGEQGMLEHSLRLYESCHQILDTILSPPGDDTDRLKAMVLNNQAQIYYLMKDFKKMNELLQQLRQLCPVFLKAGFSQVEGNVFHGPKLIKEISINVLLVTGPPSVAPSA